MLCIHPRPDLGGGEDQSSQRPRRAELHARSAGSTAGGRGDPAPARGSGGRGSNTAPGSSHQLPRPYVRGAGWGEGSRATRWDAAGSVNADVQPRLVLDYAALLDRQGESQVRASPRRLRRVLLWPPGDPARRAPPAFQEHGEARGPGKPGTAERSQQAVEQRETLSCRSRAGLFCCI